MLLMPSTGVFFFQNYLFRIYLSGTLSLIRVPNDLDPDQDRRSVGAKLGPECS